MDGKVCICGINTSDLPRISEKESAELLRRISAGDTNARDEFIVANFRLVLSIIKRFRLKTACSDDVFQAGTIGLIKAIDRFDVSFGVRFSTYAVPMIIGEIKRFLKGANSMRVPRSVRDTAYHALRARSEIEKRLEEPTLETIAKEMNISAKSADNALQRIRRKTATLLSREDPEEKRKGQRVDP